MHTASDAHERRQTAETTRSKARIQTTQTKAAAMNEQIMELLAILARGVDRMPLPHMPGAPSFDGTNVTAFIEKYESLARLTNCDVTASAVIGHFPYYCTEDVCETVRMLPGYCDDGSRSWPTLRAQMLDIFRQRDLRIQARQPPEAV